MASCGEMPNYVAEGCNGHGALHHHGSRGECASGIPQGVYKWKDMNAEQK